MPEIPVITPAASIAQSEVLIDPASSPSPSVKALLTVKSPLVVKPEVAVISPEIVGVAVQAVPATVKFPPKEVRFGPEIVKVLFRIVAPWRDRVEPVRVVVASARPIVRAVWVTVPIFIATPVAVSNAGDKNEVSAVAVSVKPAFCAVSVPLMSTFLLNFAFSRKKLSTLTVKTK